MTGPLPNFRPISIVAKWLDASRYHHRRKLRHKSGGCRAPFGMGQQSLFLVSRIIAFYMVFIASSVKFYVLRLSAIISDHDYVLNSCCLDIKHGYSVVEASTFTKAAAGPTSCSMFKVDLVCRSFSRARSVKPVTDGRQLSSNICWMTNVGRQMSVVCQQMSDDIC